MPLTEVPPRTVQFCRKPDGTTDCAFLRAHFARRISYNDVNEAFEAIRTFEFSLDPEYGFTAESYTLQIEHFPDEEVAD